MVTINSVPRQIGGLFYTDHTSICFCVVCDRQHTIQVLNAARMAAYKFKVAVLVLFSNFRSLEPKQRYTFKKNEKLKSRKTIEQLFREGNAFSSFPLRVLWRFNEAANTPLQAGIAVGSKHFKNAVDRNRIKRLMREAYRLQKNELQALLTQQQKQLAVFIIYVGNEIPDYDSVFKKTGLVLKRLIKITHEDPAANT